MDIDEFKINIERHVKTCIEELSKDNRFFDNTIKGYELRLNKGYETILLCNSAVIRIILSKTNETSLQLSEKHLDLFGLQNEVRFTKSDVNWGKVSFNDSVAIQIINNIKAVFERCYLDESVESFSCCSRYEECSDEKKCIHPDIKFAKGCYYKMNLENGRIFYGKNRNTEHLPSPDDCQ